MAYNSFPFFIFSTKRKPFVDCIFVCVMICALQLLLFYRFCLDRQLIVDRTSSFATSYGIYLFLQIELRRAYNCEIMLTKVKVPLPELMVSYCLQHSFFQHFLWNSFAHKCFFNGSVELEVLQGLYMSYSFEMQNLSFQFVHFYIND